MIPPPMSSARVFRIAPTRPSDSWWKGYGRRLLHQAAEWDRRSSPDSRWNAAATRPRVTAPTEARRSTGWSMRARRPPLACSTLLRADGHLLHRDRLHRAVAAVAV